MATIKYNPLLKRNLQEINDETPFDPSEIESEIADLQQKKVTKFFSATDTLQAGEIAQYQGESTDVFINGYFYKKQVTPIVIPAGTFSLNFLSTFTTPLFTIPQGKYFFVENSSVEFGRFLSKSFDNVYWHAVQPCNVGNPVVSNNGNVAYITYVSNNYPTSDTLDHDWNNPESKLNTGYYAVFSNYNGTNLLVALSQPQAEISSISSFAFLYNNLIFPIPNVNGIGATHLTQDETIYYYSYTRVDTQPQPATATTTAAGLMSAADKSKLDGIAADANKYTLPTATPTVLGGVKVGANLAIANGVLSGNYSNATTSSNGLMSVEDKLKVNTIGIVYRGLLQHNIQVMQSGSNLVHVHCQDLMNDNICLDCYVAAQGTIGNASTFTWHYTFTIYDQTKLDIACNSNGIINVINNTGRADSDFILFVDKLI